MTPIDFGSQDMVLSRIVTKTIWVKHIFLNYTRSCMSGRYATGLAIERDGIFTQSAISSTLFPFHIMPSSALVLHESYYTAPCAETQTPNTLADKHISVITQNSTYWWLLRSTLLAACVTFVISSRMFHYRPGIRGQPAVDFPKIFKNILKAPKTLLVVVSRQPVAVIFPWKISGGCGLVLLCLSYPRGPNNKLYLGCISVKQFIATIETSHNHALRRGQPL